MVPVGLMGTEYSDEQNVPHEDIMMLFLMLLLANGKSDQQSWTPVHAEKSLPTKTEDSFQPDPTGYDTN